MRAITIAMITAAALAACSTTPDEAPPAAGGAQPGSGSGPQTQGAGKPPVTGVDLTKPGAGTKGGAAAGRPGDRSVYYDYDKFDIKDQYKGTVDAHAKFLRANPATKMLIQGNTDERGSREYNIALGQRRSEGVRRSLVLLGAREDQVEATSLGEEKPKSAGHDEGAWQQNRRSDMLYPGEY